MAHDHSSERRIVSLPDQVKIDAAQWYSRQAALLAREGQGTAAAERAERAQLYLEYVAGTGADTQEGLMLSRARGEASLRAQFLTAVANLKGSHPAPALQALDAVRQELDALPVTAEHVEADETWLMLLGWLEGLFRGVALRQQGDFSGSRSVVEAVAAGLAEEQAGSGAGSAGVEGHYPTDPLQLLEQLLSLHGDLSRTGIAATLRAMAASQLAATEAAAGAYKARTAEAASKMFSKA